MLIYQKVRFATPKITIPPAQAVTDLELLNLLVQFVYDFAIVYFCGWKAMSYLLLSLWLGLGLHPSSGHFISDHYVFEDKQETSSYYGLINLVTFNVGHHVEHHDFPFIAGCNLPKVG
jgi:sphingolipid delta-4 desaturase